MGLFGLAAFSASQRTKEIGIRKVLGASVNNLVNLISRDFPGVGCIGIFLCHPPLPGMPWEKWLEGFAYGIQIHWWVFAVAGGFAMLLAFLTISSQAYKAALTNPVDCLVDE